MPFLRLMSLKPRQVLLVVIAVAAFSSLISLGSAPLIDWDENMQSGVAREIYLSGDLFQLQLNGQPFTEKPPLFFLEMAGFFKMLGVSEASARLTSAINSLLFVAALFGIARYLIDTEKAALWCLMYISALIPLVLSRAAMVECTFNALMALGALCLVAYDESRARRARPQQSSAGAAPAWHTWAWLLAAAVALGLAVLAKGPSGGAVPLVAFGAYKIVRRETPLHLIHWVVCGALALAIAVSWYTANYLLHGGTFVAEFARFMAALFSKPVQGHGGPIYYHAVSAVFGLFPWTPLLLLYVLPEVRATVLKSKLGAPLLALGIGWAGFILVIFSIVTTKLPHYSSGMYVPLTLLSALALQGAMRSRTRIPRWLAATMAGFGLILGVVLAVLPYQFASLAGANGFGLDPAPQVPLLAFLPGVILAVGVAVGAIALRRGRTLLGALVTAVTMGAFIIGFWRVHLPLFAAYNQGPMIALMDEAYRNGGELALYRNVSYAALFYGGRTIDMLDTEKFTGDAARLDTPGATPLYVIAPKGQEQRLLKEHPHLTFVRGMGELVMYRLPAKGE